MDDFDDERFSRQGLLSASAPRHAGRPAAGREATGRRQIEGSREEQRLGADLSLQGVRVRGLDEQERGRIQLELQLLATLEVAGISAAPAVLELEDDGYVREVAPVLSCRRGRRAAGTTTPPTGERRALAGAREALDELIGALHERSWVLGAAHGGGLGLRADGSVVALDLRGLRRDDSLSARQEDRRWVDSVLQDQDRTLRRRVHLDRPRVEGDALPTPRGRCRAATTGPLDRFDEPRADPGPSRVKNLAPLGAAAAVLSSIREVLRQPRLRRTAALSAVLVLLLGGALTGLGAWWAQGGGATGTQGDPPVAAEPAQSVPGPAPRIEEPQMLVAQLAGSRHAYVTGLSASPASAPGSTALKEDQRLRVAYTEVTVRAGGPVVHSAEVLEQPGPEGTAVVHALTSMEELLLEDAAGTTRVPATEPSMIRLVLHWDGEQWRIVSADPLPGTAEADAP
ncbi:hypothetical protein [Brachybacterium avium]|nr:hypothetical protein [Brachybacterium avium]